MQYFVFQTECDFVIKAVGWVCGSGLRRTVNRCDGEGLRTFRRVIAGARARSVASLFYFDRQLAEFAIAVVV